MFQTQWTPARSGARASSPQPPPYDEASDPACMSAAFGPDNAADFWTFYDYPDAAAGRGPDLFSPAPSGA